MTSSLTQDDFIDSHTPLEFDVERADDWPMPPVKPWEPKPLTWWQSINRWLGGQG